MLTVEEYREDWKKSLRCHLHSLKFSVWYLFKRPTREQLKDLWLEIAFLPRVVWWTYRPVRFIPK